MVIWSWRLKKSAYRNFARNQLRFFFVFCFQLTEETLGTSEKTELDAHFEHLAERANATKTWTEKILRNMEAVLTPNPGEIFLYYETLKFI